ncbi:MAG TPA: enoyl-CoA hydratase-related protein [Steroidobacteraceae bacterium]|nr:enoyl-CoA hydratase-related protein [Steroidobacteraceae bacterium]
MPDLVLLTRDARGVATITLNRPDKRNAFDATLITQLHAAVQSVEDDSSVRVVVLTGAGNVFSAGADLAHMRRQGTMSQQENYEDAHAFAQCLRALDGLSKPVVARVNGGAYGGGVGLIACADIAIGMTTAKFALTEVRFGIVPAVISPYVVAAIGARHARRWFLTAMALDAKSARGIDLLHQVVADIGSLDAAVEESIVLLLKGGALAHREAKQLLRDVRELAANDLPHHTASLLARLRSSPEGKEGLAAFLENRKTDWDRS